MASERSNLPGDNADTGKLRFPKGYNPDSPETKARRQKLFEEIARNRTPETDAAMNKLAERFLGRFNS